MSSSPSPSPSPPPSPTVAGPPFDKGDADVILRSSDNVEFRVFKVILSLASPVFESLFSLPQPDDPALLPITYVPGSPPIVELAEDSATLEAILLLCYPGSKAILAPSVRSVWDFAAALTKYDMEAVMGEGKEVILSQFVEKHAVSIYALACHFGWRDVAERAAAETLKIKSLGRTTTYVDEMETMTAATYQRLISYHIACGEIAQKVAVGKDSPRACALRLYLPRKYAFDGNKPPAPWNVTSAVEGADWFVTYRTAIGRELWSRPSPSTLYDDGSSSFKNVVTRGLTGKLTSPQAELFGSLVRARQHCAEEVQEAISTVELEFKS
ncbi:hypothetical protein F5I97DRAFT_107081 [Phlebopus sp. FC_14]|nr:hypothetical protein F5I97DRAFT_107081 [Phlebopus sp. FC_14]